MSLNVTDKLKVSGTRKKLKASLAIEFEHGAILAAVNAAENPDKPEFPPCVAPDLAANESHQHSPALGAPDRPQ